MNVHNHHDYRYRYLWLVLVLVLPLAMLAATFSRTPYPYHAALAQGSTEGAVSPASGRPGTMFSFYVAGLQGEEKVVYWFNTPDGGVHADDVAYRVNALEGRADWTWKAPLEVQPGAWELVALGMNSGRQHVLPFVIESPYEEQPGQPLIGGRITNAPDVGVEPPAALPGNRFTFFAEGFWEYEPVHFWATDPCGDGHAGDNGYWVRANEQGRADWHWRHQISQMYGVWVMVARGEWSKHERVVYFEVLEPGAPPAGSHTGERPMMAVEPSAGPPGAEFRFSGIGFWPGEDVEYTPVDPDGVEDSHRRYQVEANLNGRADWVWRTPSLAKPGIWSMVAVGKSSGLRYKVTFEVHYSVPVPIPTGD